MGCKNLQLEYFESLRTSQTSTLRFVNAIDKNNSYTYDDNVANIFIIKTIIYALIDLISLRILFSINKKSIQSYTYDACEFRKNSFLTTEITKKTQKPENYAKLSSLSCPQRKMQSLRTSQTINGLIPASFAKSTSIIKISISCYYGLRYYNSNLGRWINRDPIGEKGGMNVYAFCYNNAVNYWDDLGLKVNGWTGKVIKGTEKTPGVVYEEDIDISTKEVLDLAKLVKWGLYGFGAKEASQDFSHWVWQTGKTDFDKILEEWSTTILKDNFDILRKELVIDCKTSKEAIASGSIDTSKRVHLYLGNFTLNITSTKLGEDKIKVKFHIDDKYNFTKEATASFAGIEIKDNVWINLKNREEGYGVDFDRVAEWEETLECCEDDTAKEK